MSFLASSTASRRRRHEVVLGYLLVLPALAFFSVFTFYPFARNFKLALYVTPPYPNLPSRYVGLSQVGQVLTSSSFLTSFETTILFSVMVVPLGLFLGLALAVAAHRKLRAIAIYQTIFSSTVVTSIAVTAVIFGTLMNPVVGLLPWLGVNTSPPLLENPQWALPAIAVLTVWQGIGLSFIIMSAGLQSVPDDLLEASRVDGASSWTTFWRITVPLLSPIIFFALVVATITAFQSFGQIDLLTGTNSSFLHTNVLTYNIYQTLLVGAGNPGKAAILSIALFVATMLLTLLQIRLLERRVHYAN